MPQLTNQDRTLLSAEWGMSQFQNSILTICFLFYKELSQAPTMMFILIYLQSISAHLHTISAFYAIGTLSASK